MNLKDRSKFSDKFLASCLSKIIFIYHSAYKRFLILSKSELDFPCLVIWIASSIQRVVLMGTRFALGHKRQAFVDFVSRRQLRLFSKIYFWTLRIVYSLWEVINIPRFVQIIGTLDDAAFKTLLLILQFQKLNKEAFNIQGVSLFSF